MKKPIDKEYLTNTLKSFDAEVSETKYLHNNDPSVHTHDNKTILDKISKSDKGTLLFDGKEVGNTESSSGSTEYDILSTSSEVKENAVAGKLVDLLVIKEVFSLSVMGKNCLRLPSLTKVLIQTLMTLLRVWLKKYAVFPMHPL